MLKFQYIKLSQASTSQRLQLLYSTVQPNDAVAKRNFPKFHLRSTNSLSNYNTKPNHQTTGSLNY